MALVLPQATMDLFLAEFATGLPEGVHAVPLFGDVTTTSGVGLARHERHPGIVEGAAPLHQADPRRHPDRSMMVWTAPTA